MVEHASGQCAVQACDELGILDEAPSTLKGAELGGASLKAATATNATPQAMAATDQRGSRLEVESGYSSDVAPRTAGMSPATHAVSLQPAGRRLARVPTATAVKHSAAVKP